VAVEAGTPLCLPHLHEWFISKPGKTAKRLYGISSSESPEKREVQRAALMKIFLMTREEWTLAEGFPL
jgi:hypothetical protein